MGLLEDAGLENFDTLLGCNLKQSKKLLRRSLEKATTTATATYGIRKTTIDVMTTMLDTTHEMFGKTFARIQTLEAELEGFLVPASEDMKDLQTDALAQLSFQEPSFRALNYIPYILIFMMYFKVWFVPAMAIMTPVFAWILPYIFLKFMVNLPISTEQYGEIMGLMWSGSMISALGGGAKAPKPASMFSTRSIVQMIFMGISFAQSLVQPIQNAMHLHKTDTTLYKNGERVIELAVAYETMIGLCKRAGIEYPFRNPLRTIPKNDPRMAVHLVLEQPDLFRIALKDMAALEILWKMSTSPFLRSAHVIEKGAYPLLQAHNLFDISLGEKAVASSVKFTGASPHAALTGPNGGGKSSFLRAVLQCVILSQTYGYAPADGLVLRRFSWISSGLRLQDAPGNLSMFETEVWFAAKLLRHKTEKRIGLVLYDELFHSTNPPDGIRTAEIFLKRLWEKTGVISIVSTHVFDLVEKAPEAVQRLCCQAEVLPDGNIEYKYSVEEGICRVSSVKKIWERFSLMG